MHSELPPLPPTAPMKARGAIRPGASTMLRRRPGAGRGFLLALAVASALAFTPAAAHEPPVDTSQISEEFPYEMKVAELPGVRVRYVDEGEGKPTFVLLHGMPTSSYLWRNVIPHLARHGRVIAPDLVGFGASDNPGLPDYGFFAQSTWLDAFFSALRLRDVVLVVHDWGSALGFHYAARHPQNVRGLAFFEAMLDPIPGFEFWPPPVAQFMRAVRDPATSWPMLVEQNVMVELLLPGMSLRPLSPRELEAYRAPFVDPARRKAIFDLVNDLPIGGDPVEVLSAQTNYVTWLRQSPIPKLLLHAQPGAATPPSMVEWAKRSLPNLATVDLGAGLHFLQEENPHRIGEEIASWAEENGLLR